MGLESDCVNRKWVNNKNLLSNNTLDCRVYQKKNIPNEIFTSDISHLGHLVSIDVQGCRNTE